MVFFAASAVSAGLTCDGVDDLLTGANESQFDCANTTCTVSAWVTHTAAANGSGLLEKSGPGTGWQLRTTTTNNSTRGLIKDSAGANMTARTGTAAINDGGRHHIVMVFTTDTTTQATNTITLYVDGVVAQDVLTHSGALAYAANNDPVLLCKSSAAVFFTGTLDDIAIYAGDIGQAGVTQLHASQARYLPLRTPLIAYWPGDECASGATLQGVGLVDRAGNGNTLTGDDGANNTGMTCGAQTMLYSTGVW